MRMQMRRFTRRSNGFSKKIENHACAVALHTMHYNFCRIHSSLRVTPAMAAGVTGTVWEVEDVALMIEDATTTHGPRGPYRKKTAAEQRRCLFPERFTLVDDHRERMGLPPMDWEAELDRRTQRAREQRVIMAEMRRETARRRGLDT